MNDDLEPIYDTLLKQADVVATMGSLPTQFDPAAVHEWIDALENWPSGSEDSDLQEIERRINLLKSFFPFPFNGQAQEQINKQLLNGLKPDKRKWRKVQLERGELVANRMSEVAARLATLLPSSTNRYGNA